MIDPDYISKVIRGLEASVNYGCSNCPYDENDYDCPGCEELLRDAVFLLKEVSVSMAPVPPKVDIDTWVCGNCGTSLERQTMIGANVLITERFEYCPHCGQEVEWEDATNGTPKT